MNKFSWTWVQLASLGEKNLVGDMKLAWNFDIWNVSINETFSRTKKQSAFIACLFNNRLHEYNLIKKFIIKYICELFKYKSHTTSLDIGLHKTSWTRIIPWNTNPLSWKNDELHERDSQNKQHNNYTLMGEKNEKSSHPKSNGKLHDGRIREMKYNLVNAGV